MSSNRYADALAVMVAAQMPEGVNVCTYGNWSGHVSWNHDDGGSGMIDLYHVNRRPVDNRRNPTDADRDRLVELIVADARKQASDPRYTNEARGKAIAARDALEMAENTKTTGPEQASSDNWNGVQP